MKKSAEIIVTFKMLGMARSKVCIADLKPLILEMKRTGLNALISLIYLKN